MVIKHNAFLHCHSPLCVISYGANTFFILFYLIRTSVYIISIFL